MFFILNLEENVKSFMVFVVIHKLKGGKNSLSGYISSNGFTHPTVLANFFM